MTEYLSLADYLLIAEAVLDVPAEVLALSANLHLADSALSAPAASFSGTELYTPFARKAAVLCARLCNNHPLIDGNKRVAHECLREFVARNEVTWRDPIGDYPDGDETTKVMWALAAGELSEPELADWIAQRIQEPGDERT
jgi:death on curing protein